MGLLSSSANQSYGTYTSYGVQSKHRLLTVALGGVGLLVVVVGLFTLLNVLTGGTKNDLTTLAAQEDNLYQFIYAQNAKIQSTDLRKINADAGILLTSNTVALHSVLVNSYGVSSLPDSAVAQANDATSAQKLKDATLINRFDPTYKTILSDKIARDLVLAQTVERELGTGSASLRLGQVVASLQSVSNQLSGLSL